MAPDPSGKQLQRIYTRRFPEASRAAKAALAQTLMERAWHRVQAGEAAARPWPWADTSPVALLEIPRLELRQLVLEGASGRNLAFGPATVTPIESRDLVLSGHRDTHFEALEEIQPGDHILLTRPDGLIVGDSVLTAALGDVAMHVV